MKVSAPPAAEDRVKLPPVRGTPRVFMCVRMCVCVYSVHIGNTVILE